MFVLKNKEGNAVRRAKSEYQRDRLLAKGYVPVEEKPKQTRRRNNGNGRHQTADEGKTAPEQDAEEGKTAPEQETEQETEADEE